MFCPTPKPTTGNGGSAALIGRGAAGVRDLALPFVERRACDVFSYRRQRLIDAYISIIYSVPNELFKIWFDMFGYIIFNAGISPGGASLVTSFPNTYKVN